MFIRAYVDMLANVSTYKRKHVNTYNMNISDPRFHAAVEAIDAGDIALLNDLLAQHPQLIRDRYISSWDGYFKDPYLIWYIADNPIRNGKLPSNIVDVAHTLVNYVQLEAGDSAAFQLDYTFGLVATGRTPRESGVQLALIDLLIDAGVIPGTGIGAIAHGNLEAASRILERGGTMTLAAAVCLQRTEDIAWLSQRSTTEDKNLALVAAAFHGQANMVASLIGWGAQVNAYPDKASGFHSHATALHQAVYSGSLDTVKTLVEAGADLQLKDRIYHATPLEWIEYMQRENGHLSGKFALIAEYLRR